jgi:hypothetical protein
MMDLAAIAHAAGDALRDAEEHGAQRAAAFLRTQLPEMFRDERRRRLVAELLPTPVVEDPTS